MPEELLGIPMPSVCPGVSFVMQWQVTLRPALVATFVHTSVVRATVLLFVLIAVFPSLNVPSYFLSMSSMKWVLQG